MGSNDGLNAADDGSLRNSTHEQRLEQLLDAVQALSLAESLADAMEIVRSTARSLTGADGTTFVLREDEACYYADEDAISPLWKGQRFPLSQCISGWVMTQGQSCLIDDVATDERIPQDVYAGTFVRSMLMVPIRSRAPLGAIGNYWAHLHAPTATERRLLEALANSTAVALERIRVYEGLEASIRDRTEELRRANEQLRVEVAVRRRAEDEIRRVSAIDPLTGVLNRRGFLEGAARKLERIRWAGVPALMLFADVDGLKRVNDTFGHAVGDQHLCDYATVLSGVFRDGDIIGRLGGDEFAVFAEGDQPDALRQRLEAHLDDFNATAGRPYDIAASVGFRILSPPIDDAQTVTELLAAADRHMYADKWRRR